MDGNLREQNFDELMGMFAQAPIGLCCFDGTLRFVFINDYLAAINGISVEDHLGRSVREVVPDPGRQRQGFTPRRNRRRSHRAQASRDAKDNWPLPGRR